jgi:alpha-1,3-rhamnosyl/mannosyltransferase
LAAGVPVVAGDTPAVREVVGDDGILVRPKAIEDWTQALQKALESPVLTESMVARGKARAESFRWERVAAKYCELYGRVVER